MMAGSILCDECRFWDRIADHPGNGLCRRFAPHPRTLPLLELDLCPLVEASWPLTRAADRCGDGEPWPCEADR
jgi:hypothetical protein